RKRPDFVRLDRAQTLEPLGVDCTVRALQDLHASIAVWRFAERVVPYPAKPTSRREHHHLVRGRNGRRGGSRATQRRGGRRRWRIARATDEQEEERASELHVPGLSTEARAHSSRRIDVYAAQGAGRLETSAPPRRSAQFSGK